MAGIYISVPELREVVGDAAAMKLLAEYGGGNTYIPAKLPELTAEQNEQRLKQSQLAKQDYRDAKNQSDTDLADRLTRGK